MKLQVNGWLFTSVAFAVSASLWAQGPGGPPHRGNMDFIAHEMMSKTVKGAPFAADAVTTTTQALPNGTHINRTATASLYRDSDGRTRREEQSLAGTGALSTSAQGRPTVFIHDPVAQAAYVLNPTKKTAQKMAFTPHQGRGASAGAGQDATASAEPETGARGPQHFSGSVKTESLGSQVIDGLTVEGTRHTLTIPAGTIGNDQPIESVTERWYSPDLQVVVKSVRTDPRFGQTVYQLSNIRRGEQPATLFEVPSDFTVTAGGRGQRATQ
ncbi:MAG TPA: hypothetical protein VK335_34625 [Bryobacteraceae bacterium]|nr:hypothetical protein [Bryobacteraceae bacterium]